MTTPADPIETGRKLLAAIRKNIRNIVNAIRTASRVERQQLVRELQEARRQEREAKRYV
jgi:Na+/phosphate symporter